MTIDNLSEEERQRLYNAIEARKKKKRHTKNSHVPIKDTPKTQLVNREEYERRVREEALRDQEEVLKQQQRLIAKNVASWEERVGSRWAKAQTSEEAILDRVARLEKRRGLHKTSILLGGSLGIGKTWTAYAYANLAIQRGILMPSEVFVDSEAVVAGVANSGYEMTRRLNEIKQPHHRFFIIDDVGQGKFNDPADRKAIWFEILDHVYQKHLTLVLTTNLSLYPVPRVDAEGKPVLDPETGKQIVDKSNFETWLGSAAFDRLRHITGEFSDGGALSPGTKNMRDEVLRQREEQYRNGR